MNRRVNTLEEAMQLLVGQEIESVKVRREPHKLPGTNRVLLQVPEVLITFANGDFFSVSVAPDSEWGLRCSTRELDYVRR